MTITCIENFNEQILTIKNIAQLLSIYNIKNTILLD